MTTRYASMLAVAFLVGCTSSSHTGSKPGEDAGADEGAPGKPLDVAALRAAADAASDDMSVFLAELVRYPSVEPATGSADDPLPDATEQAMKAVLAKGTEFGMTARRSKNGRVGILEYGKGDETVGAVIHLDVVPAGDETLWTHAPFSGDIVGGELWGRGSQDDKGAGVSALWAAKMLVDSHAEYPRKLRLIFGTSEEVEFARDLTPYFAEEPPPDVGIVPDEAFIGNAEAGYMDAVLTFKGLGGSDARDTALYLSGGQAVNAVPEFAYVVFKSSDVAALRKELAAAVDDVTAKEKSATEKDAVLLVQTRAEFLADHSMATPPDGNLVLSSTGVAFHSSVPQLGRNAIVEVALACAKLEHLTNNALSKAFHFVDTNIGFTFDGSLLGFTPSDAGQSTSFSADLASTDAAADTVELLINTRRRANVASNDVILQAFEAAVGADAQVTSRGDNLPGYDFPATDPMIAFLSARYQAVQGEPPVISPNPGATYVQTAPKNFTLYGPVVTGEDGLYYHATDERVTVASIARNAVLFADALQALLLTDETLGRTGM